MKDKKSFLRTSFAGCVREFIMSVVKSHCSEQFHIEDVTSCLHHLNKADAAFGFSSFRY